MTDQRRSIVARVRNCKRHLMPVHWSQDSCVLVVRTGSQARLHTPGLGSRAWLLSRSGRCKGWARVVRHGFAHLAARGVEPGS